METFQHMMSRGYLVSVNSNDLLTFVDRLIHEEAKALEAAGGILSAQAKATLRREIASRAEFTTNAASNVRILHFVNVND